MSPEEAVREGVVVYAALPIVSSLETPDVTTVGEEMLGDVGAMVLGDFRDVCDALERSGQGRDPFAYFYNVYDHSVKEQASASRILAVTQRLAQRHCSRPRMKALTGRLQASSWWHERQPRARWYLRRGHHECTVPLR